MAGLLLGDPSHHGMLESGPHNFSHDKLDDPVHSSSNWYFCRKEIEENSPSRRDGIDLKKETYLRKSYCTLLQDLGMRLKVPQVTIATAIIFCHRFFLRQSHAKNDRRTIATVCMFLAGKVEETPRPLKDVILVSYEIIHKKDPAAVQRIKQKEVYEQQKELIILGERVVLTTLGFDLNVHHPYKPLVEAIKKFQVAQNALAQVAWNFVNDGLRTSLCLQFKPHHIAAGAIFLAAKFLKVKLPSDGEKVWWQEFDVTPRQLEEVSNQMLELYEQNRTAQASHGSELEGSVGGAAANHRNPDKILTIDEHAPPNRHSHAPDHSEIPRATQEEGGDRGANLGNYPSHSGPPRNMITQSNEHGSKDQRHQIQEHFSGARDPENSIEASNKSKPGADDFGDGVGSKGYRPPDVIRKIDKDKVKAALEKRRKSRGDITKKTDLMDEDDLIERELESGVELAAQERRQSWSKPLYKQEHENQKRSRSLETEELGDVRVGSEPVYENSEEGELSFDASPRPGGAWSERDGSPNRPIYGKNRYHHEPPKDVSGKGREDHIERDLKRHRQENPV